MTRLVFPGLVAKKRFFGKELGGVHFVQKCLISYYSLRQMVNTMAINFLQNTSLNINSPTESRDYIEAFW